MNIFDQTETHFKHYGGKLVQYDNKVMVIGGQSTAKVEEINPTQLSWAEHPMSPVNGSTFALFGFTALSVEKRLFIFGRLRSLK